MSAQGGFVKVYRQILDWSWYGNVNTMAVFLHLLITANHKNGVCQGVTIGRGQKSTSVKAIGDILGLTRQQTRTALSNLQATNEITIETTNKYTLITIVNYSKYQGVTELITNRTTNEQPTEQPTNNQQANHQITTNKKERNIRKKEVVTNVTTEGEKSDFEKTLDDFVEMRKKIKSPMTDRAVSLLKDKLQRLAPDNEQKQIKILEQSIESGWKSVYELKAESGTQQQPTPQQADTRYGIQL